MDAKDFVIWVCVLTVAAHIGLLFLRGYLINECRREAAKMKVQWKDFKEDQQRWKEDFENEHRSPWGITRKKAAS